MSSPPRPPTRTARGRASAWCGSRHASRPGRVVGPAAVGLYVVVALAPLPSCRGTPTDGFELDLPAGLASKVAWYEIGVFPGPACAALGAKLTGGIPPEGYVQRLAFPASNGSPPSIADLPRAKYAIGAVARAADCSVLAVGCSDVDLSQAGSVTIGLSSVATPQGACTNGATCEDAECTPGAANLGAGCSLALMGAGPLADPLGFDGTVMSAPAIVATPGGFLIGYREWDPNTGSARITVLPVDPQGGIGAAQQAQQPSCAEVEMNDAAGLVFGPSGGLVAVGRAGCPDEAGLADSGIDLALISASGTFSSPAFADLGPVEPLLSSAHALATSSLGTFVAYTQAGVANVATVSTTSLSPATSFGGPGRMVDARVAASDQIVALVADSVPGAAPPPPPPPPSDDAGNDAATYDAGTATSDDAGGVGGPSAPTLDFNMATPSEGGAGIDFTALDTPASFPGRWASVAALAGRAFVVSDGPSSDKPVAYRAFDLGASTPTVVGAYAPQGSGPVLYADVAFHQDHLFVAVERQGSIVLDAFDQATTTPTLLREVPLGGDARIPSTSSVRDGRVAVLATDARVIVAWTTQESLGPDDATGGFAVFACTTP
jgi:hypothetical protein